MTTENVVESFSKVGSEEIIALDSEVKVTMVSIFKKYPSKYFTQKDFVKGIGRSNPYVNKILRQLTADKVIVRSKGNGKYHYRLAKG